MTLDRIPVCAVATSPPERAGPEAESERESVAMLGERELAFNWLAINQIFCEPI
jgi:hypothetical protein